MNANKEAVTNFLPYLNTDLIINLSGPIICCFIEGQDEEVPPVHIRFVKLKPRIIVGLRTSENNKEKAL